MHNFDFSETDTEFWHVLRTFAKMDQECHQDENSQNEIRIGGYAC